MKNTSARRHTSPVKAFSISSITNIEPIEGVAALGRLFPSAPQDAAAAFKKPYGEISLIIGMKNRELHCTDGLFHGSLGLCRTSFSREWVLTGYSP